MKILDKKYNYDLFTQPEKTKVKNDKKPCLNLDDAELLAYMATKVTHTYATNGKHYWYYIFEDIKECDFITYLFNRNGIYPTLHYSHYFDEYKLNPVLRIRSKHVKKDPKTQTFVSLIKASRDLLRHENNNIHNNMARAMNDFFKKVR